MTPWGLQDGGSVSRDGSSEGLPVGRCGGHCGGWVGAAGEERPIFEGATWTLRLSVGSGSLIVLPAACARRSRRPRFVLVAGEGGSGKTALLRTFTARLATGEVARVTGDEGETALPYGALDQLLAQLPGDGAGTGPSEQDGRSGAVGARDSVVEGLPCCSGWRWRRNRRRWSC